MRRPNPMFGTFLAPRGGEMSRPRGRSSAPTPGMHAMSTTTGRDESMKKLGSLIKDIRVAMLTTVDEEGHLHSRPMATQETEFDGTLWFFTRADSPKVGEIDREQRVNVSYADSHRRHYV